MKKLRSVWKAAQFGIVLVCALGIAGCQVNLSRTGEDLEDVPVLASAPQDDSRLIIENDSELPDTFPQVVYELRFHARGGVPVFHWKLEKGALPPGMKLEDDGLLHGQAERAGEFQFTVSVTDGGKPQQAVQKGFILRVRSALSVSWKNPAKVNGNRIEGSVEVSNASSDDMDLTFYDTLSGKKTKPAPPAIQPEEKGETDPVKDSIKESAVSQEPVKVKTESKEKAAITENKEETNSKETFIIQVVSLKDQKKAEEIKDHLKKLGYNSELDSTHSHGKKLYRVKLTGYETRNEAVKIATAIEKKIQLKCIVLGSK